MNFYFLKISQISKTVTFSWSRLFLFGKKIKYIVWLVISTEWFNKQMLFKIKQKIYLIWNWVKISGKINQMSYYLFSLLSYLHPEKKCLPTCLKCSYDHNLITMFLNSHLHGTKSDLSMCQFEHGFDFAIMRLCDKHRSFLWLDEESNLWSSLFITKHFKRAFLFHFFPLR